MPALSQQQQKLFGLALSVKRGDTPRSEASEDVLKIVDTMTEKEIEDFAGTEHKGLPKKVEQKIREMARQTIRERMMGEAKFNRGDMVRVIDKPKYIWDKQFWGKSGYVKNIMGRDILVSFPNGRTILVDPKDLEMNPNESVNEDFKSVVGKTVFSDGKGKLVFGYYKDDDGVTLVDYKTWAKLNMKDVSKGDTNKDRVIKAILKNQKQFNKKVDYNMWAKKTNPSFEQKMDWFIKNGWISNINKGGIKESVNENKNVGHYERVGNQTIVDSNFVNYSKGVLQNSELVHLGMGDFELKTPNGNITFNRSGRLVGIGQDFVGRPHRVTDNKGGKLVDELIKRMVKKKTAILSMSESVNEAKSEKDFKLGTPVVFDGDSGEVVSNPKHQRVWTPSGRTMVGKGVKGIMKYGSNSFFVPDWSKTKQFNESINGVNFMNERIVKIADGKYDVKKTNFKFLQRVSKRGLEGIVFLGAGGDLNQWVNGINDLWNKDKIGSGLIEDKMMGLYQINTSGGRTDLVMIFKTKSQMEIGKLAMWRLRFGDASWLSDYVVNYKDQHNESINEATDRDFEKVYSIFDKKDYFGLKDSIKTMLGNWQRALDKGDKGAQKYSKEDIIKHVTNSTKERAKHTYDELVKAIKNKDIKALKSKLRHDQKFSLAIFTQVTGKKLPKSTRDIHSFLDNEFMNESITEGRAFINAARKAKEKYKTKKK